MNKGGKAEKETRKEQLEASAIKERPKNYFLRRQLPDISSDAEVAQ